MNFENQGLDQAANEMLAEFGEELGKSRAVDASAKGLAFWLRESNLRKMHEAYSSLQFSEMSVRRPVGRIFQIAPSNVDLLFLYIWSLGLLTGNSISTKIGSKIDSAALSPVLEILNSVLRGHPDLASKTGFFTADRQDPRIPKEIGKADLVVGWGSDDTIQKLRFDAVHAGKTFIGFPHRFSCALINADFWRESTGTEQSNFLARFVSEVSAFDQSACTSPKTLIIVGSRENRDHFVDSLTKEKVVFSANHVSGYLRFVNKVRLHQELGLRTPIPVKATRTMEVVRGIEKTSQVSEYKCVLGIVPLIELDSLGNLAAALDRQVQTLSVWGYKPPDVSNLLARGGVQPIRTVRIGSSHNFDFVWDGINLLGAFTWPQRV